MALNDPFTLDLFSNSSLSSGLGLGVTAFPLAAELDHVVSPATNAAPLPAASTASKPAVSLGENFHVVGNRGLAKNWRDRARDNLAAIRLAAKIEADMVLLVDSGGQYLDGTTDVTRTVAIGRATPEQKRRFTLVLKGHIALAGARFVKGTTGGQLDALARFALWQEGLDYDHGTGHGVGTFLGVHEGPQRIGKAGSGVALEPGMVISNEPGYYKTGEYGIRIENLVAVREAVKAPDGAEKPLLEFETITMAPIDLDMVDESLLTAPEKAWLNGYHAQVRTAVGLLVDAETKTWLDEATRAI